MDNMEQEQMIETDGIRNFAHLALPCAVYTLIFTFCMYKNWAAITAPIWIASLIGLVTYLIRSAGKELKRGSMFLAGVMMIISFSCFYTMNGAVLFTDYVAEFLLFVTFVLHNSADDSGWDIAKLLSEIISSVFSSIGKLGTPFSDGRSFFKLHAGSRKTKIGGVLVGILAAFPILIVLGLLLASADAVFESIFSTFFEEVIKWQNILGILCMLAFGFFSSYCGMRYAQTNGPMIRVKEIKKSEPVTAITITSMVAALYLVFSAVQMLFLFMRRFTLPDGMTYAEYARQGFFQLLFVSIVNLIVVLMLKKHIERSRGLNAVLLVICGCTYIMIASSAIRMIMYIKAYSLTFDRISVLFALFLLAVLFAGVIILVLNDRFSFRPFCIAAVSLVYIPFAFLNADKTIASYNLRLYDSNQLVNDYGRDYYYISSLSSDAAPAILDYFEEKGISEEEMIATDWYIEYCYNNDIDGAFPGIRTYNISKHIANTILPVPKDYGWTS